MNPLTNVKNIAKLNELELAKGTVDKKSWHDMYKDSAWIFIGGLSYGLTEGDVLSVFSQFGEIVNINLIRDTKTGKIKGYCFLCYGNQKSTILAVDNLNGIKLCGRTIRVDHVSNYKPPKDRETDDDLTKQLKNEGCAPKPIKVENAHSSNASEPTSSEKKKSKKAKKEKKKHKKKNKKHESRKETENFENVKVKEEKTDPGYDKNELLDGRKSRTRNETASDSSDSESSSSDSDVSNSSNQQLSRQKASHHIKHKNTSEQSHREKYDSHISSKSGSYYDRVAYGKPESIQNERSASSRDGYYKSNRKKRYQDAAESSPRSRSPDKDRKRKYYDEDEINERSDSHKKKHAAEYKTSSRHQRHDSSSSSGSVSDQEQSRFQDKRHEKYGKGHFDEEKYSKSRKKYDDSQQRDYDRYSEKSKHERDRR
ncbi:hypothetical protein JTE90_026293 [Oedothorax gibbosus]|uniref:RRM domain-containing protein n=1 Tax=Oedothorax gibbosus TaxID=931172 RepID=A0AAV6U498_9ARAC|nr:hypothetical protein JTE90_026293 [Oedothorax gibbosus]